MRSTFEHRFLSEMSHIEPRDRMIINVLAMMEQLYGDQQAVRMQRLIQADPRWR